MPKPFAQRLNNAKNMLAGLSAHTNELSSWGITAEELADGNQLYSKASKLQDDRNALKARCQETTQEAKQVLTQLETFCGNAKKIVRMRLPQETWPEFGFRQGEYADRATTQTNVPPPTQ